MTRGGGAKSSNLWVVRRLKRNVCPCQRDLTAYRQFYSARREDICLRIPIQIGPLRTVGYNKVSSVYAHACRCNVFPMQSQRTCRTSNASSRNERTARWRSVVVFHSVCLALSISLFTPLHPPRHAIIPCFWRVCIAISDYHFSPAFPRIPLPSPHLTRCPCRCPPFLSPFPRILFSTSSYTLSVGYSPSSPSCEKVNKMRGVGAFHTARGKSLVESKKQSYMNQREGKRLESISGQFRFIGDVASLRQAASPTHGNEA